MRSIRIGFVGSAQNQTRQSLLAITFQSRGIVISVKRKYWVYILTNRWNTVLYIGVTNNIARRVVQHKSGKGGMFTRKYNIGKLVYFEMTDDILSAIRREKQLKAGSRDKKNALITFVNPDWRDLSDEVF